jgi:hypothetical protein
MAASQPVRRPNPDGTMDSICTRCLVSIGVTSEVQQIAAHPLGVSLPVSELQFHWQQRQAVPGVRFAVPA